MEKKNRTTNTYLFKRILAGITDYGLWVFLFWLSFEIFGTKGIEGSYSSDYDWLSLFGLWIGLMIITELTFQSTIGNFIWGLKVIREDGNKLKFWQSTIRHCFDMFDMWPLGLVGILTIKFTKKNQRLGDIMAKTIVVERKE